MIKIIIPGELTDLNTYINAERSNRFAGAKLKATNTDTVIWCAKQIKVLQPLENVRLTISWYCKNKKKDKDNISFAKKFIWDGLAKAGIIKNDGWNNITGFEDKFYIDTINPRIEVEIWEG